MIRTPYLLFLGDAPDQLAAKVAQGITDWRPENAVGQLRLPGCGADVGLTDMTLEEAQLAKLNHIARKLTISPGQTVLDIGCGWGGMAMHLAEHFGARVTGITLSEEQHAYAVAKRIRSGNVHVNGAPVDSRMPFGGYKQSGNGREWSEWGFEEYLETKAILGLGEA